eukprot:TRINITY_DN22812_c0_g2_i4.p1 TRINITY_DN22812_c0_g2~~TRINITY_DN22812_c0_g2_i4.p1  ORF type:complete len:670 (+),score=21.26 TRINITY_DN22812_c0_g2_i4:55-2064(+)
MTAHLAAVLTGSLSFHDDNNKEEAAATTVQRVFRRRKAIKVQSEISTLSLRSIATCTESNGSYLDGFVYTEKYVDGSRYQGTLSKDGRDGRGRMVYANGDIYEGEFVADQQHLQGCLSYASGDKYTGEFAFDRLDGEGCFESASGWVYIGQFCGGEIDGEGVLRHASTTFPQCATESCSLGGPLLLPAEAPRSTISVRALSAATRSRGWRSGCFSLGVAHGHGIVEFEVDSPESGDCASSSDATRKSMPLDLPRERLSPHFCEGVWNRGRREGLCVIHVEGYARYEGLFSADEASGRGRLLRHVGDSGDHDEYIGEFSRGLADGCGVYAGPNDTQYAGEFRTGKRHGRGLLRMPTATYSGEFRNGQRHGYGRYTSETKVYEGEYADGERQGCGRMTDREPDGSESCYEGQLSMSMRDGWGRLRRRTLEYRGQWRKNMRHGHGSQTWQTTGDVYTGQWEGDRMHGRGDMTCSSMRYAGEFVQGEINGHGRQVWTESNDSYVGQFEQGQPHGVGLFSFALDGTGAVGDTSSRFETYEGCVNAGIFQGTGRYESAGGCVYDGEWRSGRQDGEGQLLSEDGQSYTGAFKDDRCQGQGTLVLRDGTAYSGHFENNIRLGSFQVTYADGARQWRLFCPGVDADGVTFSLIRFRFPKHCCNHCVVATSVFTCPCRS